MSFLAPLYALGLLAIAAPILFHLIQRRPKGEQTFSSLMFLTPSPPRLTRRSRLDNLLLLLLRALALMLLAAAFARPFLRSYLQDGFLPAREVVILLDTSASMKRASIWQQAIDETHAIIDGLQPNDRVALLTFDSEVTNVIGLEQPTPAVTAAQRKRLFDVTLAGIQPSWKSTDLGTALTVALELLQGSEVENEGTQPAAGHIILISDLQVGSQMRALDGLRWPEQVRLDLRRVSTPSPSNASIHLLAQLPAADADQLSIRVFNSSSSHHRQFQLGWRNAQGAIDPNASYAVHVPPNQQRSVTVERHPTSRTLLLEGDQCAFDNQLYIARPVSDSKTLLHLGIADSDPASLDYFLKKVILDTPRYTVQVETQWPPAELADLDPIDCPLVIVSQPLNDHDIAPMQRFLRAGGHALFVLDRQSSKMPQTRTALARLLELETLDIVEADVDDYAMFGQVSFQHPLFAPFADPRFNDFTKIRIWQHRRISSDHEQPWDVLVNFDDQSPALVERAIGDGVAWILTTGWQPSESQLALSTKFVPLLARMFDDQQAVSSTAENLEVDAAIEFPEVRKQLQVTKPSGETMTFHAAPFIFNETDEPGIYGVLRDERPYELAVNVSIHESRTDPMDIAELEQRGVVLGDYLSGAEIAKRDRQLKDIELESHQQLWRWLIVAALCLLIAESWLAGRLGKRGSTTSTLSGEGQSWNFN